MLIQSDPKTGEPLLLSSDLPQCVRCSDESKNVRVLLMDSQVSFLIGTKVVADDQDGNRSCSQYVS